LLLKKDGKVVTTRVKDKESKEYEQPAIASFTADDARKAELLNKDNWKKWREDMYFARALTRLQRRYAPGVLGLSLLSREEIDSDPALHAPPVERPSIKARAAASLEEVKNKYKTKTEPPKEETTKAGAEVPGVAPPRPAAKGNVTEKSQLGDKGTPEPPASKLTQQLKQSVKNEKAKAGPEGFEFPEEAW
jgi:hypothetical protein